MPPSALGNSSDNYVQFNSIASAESTEALPQLCAKIHQKVDAFLKSEPATERLRNVQKQSRISLRVLEEALQRYSLDELSLSYNGGKDCLVLLILYLSALHTHSTKAAAATTASYSLSPQPLNNHIISNHTSKSEPPLHPPTNHHLPPTLHSVYIISKHPFKQVDDFVDHSVRTYHLDLARYAKPMKEAFADYLADHPRIKAIFVGTRRTDPHGANLSHFDPTDRGWPAFMRIHPVIDWHYAEIWAFIRELGIEYCGLYDLGYTSLGGTTDTHPNPALREGASDGGVDGQGEVKFRPAYELVDDEEERLGRDR